MCWWLAFGISLECLAGVFRRSQSAGALLVQAWIPVGHCTIQSLSGMTMTETPFANGMNTCSISAARLERKGGRHRDEGASWSELDQVKQIVKDEDKLI